MKYIGVPRYISSGAHTRGKETFRFMVMERFGSDVQKIFEKAGKKFSRHTVCATNNNLSLRDLAICLD
jgi:vaccinia related kinase